MRTVRPTRRSSLHVAAWGAALLLGAVAPIAIAVPEVQALEPSRPTRRAWLGVELGRGPAGGVLARHVSRTSPADVAGVKAGDQIVAIDGKPVDVPRDVVVRVAEIGPDRAMKLRIRRGGVESELSVSLVAHPGDEEVMRRDKVGTFAPGWGPLATTSGVVPASVQAARGRVVIVDFWASWCGPCKLVTPTLSSLQDRFGAQGLTVLGISSDKPEVAARSARNLGIRYATGAEKDGEASLAYGVRAIPTMFVIDKGGVVREVLVGFHPRHAAELERLVVRLLAEPAVAGASPAPPGMSPERPPAPTPRP